MFALKKSLGKLQKGDIVTYSCISFTHKGIPRNPIILRKRGDITWEEVCWRVADSVFAVVGCAVLLLNNFRSALYNFETIL